MLIQNIHIYFMGSEMSIFKIISLKDKLKTDPSQYTIYLHFIETYSKP